jgi:3-isopropylmalate/(R)-2-methylmalate dehydratase small subunit
LKIKGTIWKYGDGLNTDYMIPGKYLELTDPVEMASHAMEGIDPDFKDKVQKGDIIVAGRNCGLGSSREHAPLALKYAGVGAVVAEGFARIFYRNSFNVGLPALECQGIQDATKTGDTMTIHLEAGIITINDKTRLEATPPPPFMIKLIQEGGLVPFLRNNMDEW